MSNLFSLVRERTDLGESDLAHLQALVVDWTLLADLAVADLVLWLPTWNQGGFVVGAQVRPTTGPTQVPDDLVGRFVPRGRRPGLDRALALRRTVAARHSDHPSIPAAEEAIPVMHEGRVVGVVARHSSVDSRWMGRLEQVYLDSADDLAAMVAAGAFPFPTSVATTGAPPRVGDGLLRLDPAGVVEFASPNAQSAFHRLGLAADLVGSHLGTTVARMVRRPGPVDEALMLVASGRAPGGAEVENRAAVVNLRGIPLRRGSGRVGALVLARDVTDLRRRDQALLTKDATIREIHHRVKNNLQTVAALLRLQARRIESPAGRVALEEAVRRVGAIAVVHETLAHAPGETVAFDEVADRIVALAADVAVATFSATAGDLTDPATASVPIRRRGSFGVLPTEKATPLAMSLTELLMNAVEHGIGPKAGGRIDLEVETRAGRLHAAVVDDGDGLPESFALESSSGLGLQIVRALVEDELGGSLRLIRRSSTGTRAVVDIPLS